MVITFDLGNESFGVIQGPKDRTGMIKSVFHFEGCLGLATYDNTYKLDLWMLKHHTNWVVFARVDVPLGVRIYWITPYLTRTGELVLAQCQQKGSNCFYLYNLFTRQFHIINTPGPRHVLVNHFVENPISLKDS
ncbi:hypothetical protein ACHQM5_017313 [Ranunculus cassubicifolius]